MLETSIASAAASTDYIEHSEPLAKTGTMIFGRGFVRQDYVDLFKERTVSANLRNYHLDDVHLDTAAMTLIKDGHKIRETNYLVPPTHYDRACVTEAGLVRLEGGTDHVMARAFDNYYHWLVQTIPAVDWSLRTMRSAKVALLSGHLNVWQTEMLALLDYDRVPRIALDPGHHYSIPTLHYSEFQNGSTSFKISRCAQATYKRLADAAINSSLAEADIIYIARTDTINRIAENEGEVIKLLKSEGVSIVIPGQLSVSQQINLFGKADAIIGPHGAGLTNIVFCRPGTIFYELSPIHYLNPCFARLAQAAGLNYLIDLFESSLATSGDPHDRGWLIEPDIIMARVREIKLRVASLRPRPVFTTPLEAPPPVIAPRSVEAHLPVLPAAGHAAGELAVASQPLGTPAEDIVFDEVWYLEKNPDIAKAVAEKRMASGKAHYLLHGRTEGRSPVPPPTRASVS
jgi:hypothetical protein